MPVSNSVDQEQRLVRVHAEGVLTESEILQACREQTQNPEADLAFHRLIDLRKVKTLDLSSKSVRQWPRMLQELVPTETPSRMAIVASSDAVFGMARMFEIAQGRSPFEVRVFRDMKSARDWLKLEN